MHQIERRGVLHLLPACSDVGVKLNRCSLEKEERGGDSFLFLTFLTHYWQCFVLSRGKLLFSPHFFLSSELSLTHDSLSKQQRTNLNWFCNRRKSIRSRHRGAHLRTTCSSWQSQQIPLGKHWNFHLIFNQNPFKWKSTPELMSMRPGDVLANSTMVVPWFRDAIRTEFISQHMTLWLITPVIFKASDNQHAKTHFSFFKQ